MIELPNKKDLNKLITSSLVASASVVDVLTLPTIVLPIRESYWKVVKEYGKRSEETALTFFRNVGFKGERTWKNLGGYPGLLRELLHPPAWVKVEPEDVDGSLTSERKLELSSLFWHSKEYGNDSLLSSYLDYRNGELRERQLFFDKPIRDADRLSIEIGKEQFTELLDLASCIRKNEFDSLIDVVFEFNEFEPAVGAPDLFIWDSEASFWFFAEVKGPRDSIRDTQLCWIRRNWSFIRGKMLFVVLDV